MSTIFDEFIPLDRTFHELAVDETGDDDAELRRLFGKSDALCWPDLLAEPRVVLLSEAGSGKTEEIRNIARQLRKEGRAAFFLRIEHVVDDFEACFEEGSLEEFGVWIVSGEEGWLLLDSVDEARLRDPKDFERAIRRLGVRIKPNVQNAHILISGRTTAWRPKTDLLLCHAAFPYIEPDKAADEDSAGSASENVEVVGAQKKNKPYGPFKVVALDDLHGEQVDRFAIAKGVTDIRAFRSALDRAEAWSFTTRPLDLAETAEFWNQYQRIGSRLELMRSSIAKRLEERDQDRSDARPITTARARTGARLVAAAATLTQESAIRVPDGSANAKGISIKDVLTDWNDQDCATLLSRPIFDEGIYGTVRFHHRSVREYLTAEWLHGLIVDEGSRRRIESLFFRTQYGIEVIVPTMRPILPWLAILDERILARVVRLAPEVLFEGGDPSQLPLETRRSILRQTCEQLAQPAHGRSATDYGAVQRFTNPDLTEDIRALLAQYKDDDDIVWFLLRMVWQGELKGLAGESRAFALLSRSRFTRIAALRALSVVGSPEDRAAVRLAFVDEDQPLRRDWLAEMLPDLPNDSAAITWLLTALERAGKKKRFEVDSLSDAIARYIAEVPIDLLGVLMTGFRDLLKRPPVVERRLCEISVHYGWLAKPAGEAIVRLIEARQAAALEGPTLSILRMLPIAQEYGDRSFTEIRGNLPKLVSGWPELNHALFWLSVAEARAEQDEGKRLIDYWHVMIFGAYWAFAAEAFDRICSDIQTRPLLDDRLVALTLAFAIYRENGRPAPWRNRLKRLVEHEPELDSTLKSLLHPPAGGRAGWRRQQARWKRRDARAAEREARQLEVSKQRLAERLALIRDAGKPGVINSEQYYLHQQLRDASDSSDKWTDANWRSLIPTFGQPIAEAFRDGAVGFWRKHEAKLRVEGAEANSTPFSAIFGLTGLAIEAKEGPDWLKTLTPLDAERATRFALHELNGFPNWLPALYEAFPAEVSGIIMRAIGHELATETSEGDSHYVLYDVSWHGQWLWDRVAPQLLTQLRAKRKSPGNLGYLLTIVQGSSMADAMIARLAAQKAKTTKNLTFAPKWFAVWAGVDPAAAIPALAARLAETKDPADQTALAIRFITHLVGGRREGGSARQGYRTVGHMTALYLLMHKYIREKEDIERAGKGVYSPGPRDDAQDARNALFSFIRETPGKEAYLALLDIARAHPEESSRPWMAYHAKSKAALDANVAPWTPAQVRDFNDQLVRTPANHRDLWYLAVDRLNDLRNDLEEGDASVASILQAVDQETEIRKFIGGWCRDRSAGRYNLPQEEELADAKRPDLRFLGAGFDGPVPVELKLADKWTGPHLFERLETQLCGDYLRDIRSSRGIFGLVYLGTKSYWELPNGKRAESFGALVEALQTHWTQISNQFPGVEDIAVIGIDLTKRGVDAASAKRKKAASMKARKKSVAKSPAPASASPPARKSRRRG